jgi:hypothetical protein
MPYTPSMHITRSWAVGKPTDLASPRSSTDLAKVQPNIHLSDPTELPRTAVTVSITCESSSLLLLLRL